MRDIDRNARNIFESVTAKCPQCSSLMADMGKDFESPKTVDVKAWHHMATLYSVGITFHSCGCTGPGYIPSTTDELLKHLQKTKIDYVNNLRFWMNCKQPITKQEKAIAVAKEAPCRWQLPRFLQKPKQPIDTTEAINFWRSKLNEISSAIEKVSGAI